MNKLNHLKQQLTTLQPGNQIRIHELLLLEASDEYYQEWNRNHSETADRLFPEQVVHEPISLAQWLVDNHYVWRNEPDSDYFIFEQKL